ncbi:uncharacterized protein LOC123720897 [Pieris brassicae]|uniref:uncharacterized protein LOC123720897 n=1 Tax=Pieris brassicae TaxID=7116 RepID=UPI001E65EBFA|nr:uncharacterized protein LOC123720897 [Pieris brassicae]
MLYKCINLIMFCNFLCGFYVKFSKFYMTILSTLYCASISVFILYGLYSRPLISKFYVWSNNFCIFDTICFILFTYINGTVYVSKFLSKISEIDGKLQLELSTISIKTILFFLLIFLEKIFYTLEYYARNEVSTTVYKISIAAWLVYKYGSFFNSVLRNILFELMRQRMKGLRLTLEHNINQDGVDKVEEINKTLEIYKMILDTNKSFGYIVKYYIIRDFFAAFYYVIITTIGISYNSKKSIRPHMAVDAVANILMACLPCIVLQGAINEVANIKKNLVQEFLKCPVEESHSGTRDKIKDAIKYLELNPFMFPILHLFSLNLTVPFYFINLCSTYVIVAIQFAKLA